MDDTIDEDDIAYVEGIIEGTNEETELADANYDGEVDEDDIVQIELIIRGEEKELTIIDSIDRIVTVKKPVDRIILPHRYALQTIRSLKVETDRIVGVNEKIAIDDAIFFPEFSGLPVIGTTYELDYKAILSLNPDLMITWLKGSVEDSGEKLPGVPVMLLYCYNPDTYVEEIRKLGYILDKRNEAEEFIDFYNEALNPIKDKIEEIPDEDRPKVYYEAWEPYKTGGVGSGWHAKVTMAGGNNIFGDLSGYPVVDPEEVMERNPEIIIKQPSASVVGGGYNIGTNISGLIDARNEIMNRPELALAKIEAVENENVYIVYSDVIGGTRHFVGIVYMAKWFYPDLFEDLDPQAIHQEYLTRFQGLDYDLGEHGVFVYPPLEER